VQKLIKVLRWSLPHGSKLGNSQKVHGIKFPKVYFWPTPRGVGQSDLNRGDSASTVTYVEYVLMCFLENVFSLEYVLMCTLWNMY
jgi:hypothetical protein